MRTVHTFILIAAANLMMAQDNYKVKLWANAGQRGICSQVITGVGNILQLDMNMMYKVSSVEVAEGVQVTFHDDLDLEGIHSFTVVGPKRIDDLKTIPMLSMKSNWDDAIGSMTITLVDTDTPRKDLLATQ